MTPEETRRVQTTIAILQKKADRATAVFYERLFTRNPELRQLFLGDIREQGQKLMAMLQMIVKTADSLHAIAPAIENLGIQHVRFHVKPTDYTAFGEALLEMLALELGPDFTPETRRAWHQIYGEIASLMKEAGKDVVR